MVPPEYNEPDEPDTEPTFRTEEEVEAAISRDDESRDRRPARGDYGASTDTEPMNYRSGNPDEEFGVDDGDEE
jgi:hypothetical protein